MLQFSGAFSWCCIVALTSGMYGWSRTDSRQAMLAAKLTTEPALDLEVGETKMGVHLFVNPLYTNVFFHLV